ncbi:polyprenyl synthetase family protein [Bacillus thuringiensis]|uniref:Competence protein ComX n=1 Tax=Bacillus thuringiensis TaxID=1428 RepID=A0A9X7GG70_BACTU|nr:competence protein ComX [Bacillus thuringiensis]PEB48723.1 competence protein ComX [Bacillus thuringiensis]PED22994.1 competence protein ComX [Bacillus thuringiensis]PFL10186.1 competence protein ComX [Bacillus thuringiensis]PFV36550.1 competence protein ComX [Bacillus thuringiensis]
MMVEISGFRDCLINHIAYHISYRNQSDESEILLFIQKCLSQKGKVLNPESSGFSWGELYLALSFLTKRQPITKRELDKAMGIEFIFLSADIIDDLCDGDILNPLYFKNEYPRFLLVSQYLLMQGLIYLTYKTKDTATGDLLQQLIHSCCGEWKDIQFCFSIDKKIILSEEEYMKLIEKKSGLLTETIFRTINPENRILKEITSYIGIAGQLRNDANDAMTDNKNDLQELKAYLPFLKAYEYSYITQDDFFKNLTDKQISSSPEVRALVRDYIEQSGALHYCRILSQLYYRKAFALLEKNFILSTDEMTYFQMMVIGRDHFYA